MEQQTQTTNKKSFREFRVDSICSMSDPNAALNESPLDDYVAGKVVGGAKKAGKAVKSTAKHTGKIAKAAGKTAKKGVNKAKDALKKAGASLKKTGDNDKPTAKKPETDKPKPETDKPEAKPASDDKPKPASDDKPKPASDDKPKPASDDKPETKSASDDKPETKSASDDKPNDEKKPEAKPDDEKEKKKKEKQEEGARMTLGQFRAATKQIKEARSPKKNEDIMDTMKRIVADAQGEKVKLKDGKGLLVDMGTASAITKVYDALSKQNKDKFAAALGKDRAGFMKMSGFAIKNVSY